MANQVHQVFYVQDSIEKDWHYVMKAIPRELFDMNEGLDADLGESYWSELTDVSLPLVTHSDVHDVSWLRENMPTTTVDVPARMLNTEPDFEMDASDDDIEDDTLWDFMHAS